MPGRMIRVDCKRQSDWLELVIEGMRIDGCAIVENVLDGDFLEGTRAAMYRAQEAIQTEVGREKLDRAGELGVLRLMVKYDPWFFSLLAVPEVLAFVDATVSNTAILHVQNGLILPSFEGESPDVFQTRFHRDFPRFLNGYLMSVNTFFAIDEFTPHNGATFLVPGSHAREDRPSDAYLEAEAISAECPAGSMIVFDSTLWHAAGDNRSGKDRLAVNQQFTRSYVKQQIDYVRALGDELVLQQPERTQQLLGWYTRVVTSLYEFYRPPEERLYRSGQG
jgi:ectoine hydroxylase-related dioxygenase (phytanoyl-CoA dioxygenase family)